MAAEGLINVGHPAVVPLLRVVIDEPESEWIKEGTHHVLHDMYRGELDVALQPVIAALESPESSLEVPLAAKSALDMISEIKFPSR
jgi:hypothetical protein